jgi:hypothetical protein
MIRTRELIEMCIHPDICAIVLECVQSVARDWKSIAYIGEYETCMSCPSEYVNCALRGSCKGGHHELAELMIDKGANNLNWGLHYACLGGHHDLIEFMISKGADNFNGGLSGACEGNHLDLVKLMISLGATQCDCRRSLNDHIQPF